MIDAHIHIDFYDNPGKIIRGIMKNDISAIFVTHLPELYEKQKPIIENIPQVFLAVGFHPILVNEYEFKEDIFINALNSTRFVGEVGLDYSVARTEKSKSKQKKYSKASVNIQGGIFCQYIVGSLKKMCLKYSKFIRRRMLYSIGIQVRKN